MPNFIGVGHVGLGAKDLAALAAFYRNVLGMTVVRQSPADAPFGATLFLSGHPEEEDHEVVFFSDPTRAHTAFKVASLEELRTFYRQVKERGCPSSMPSTMASRCPSTSKTRRATRSRSTGRPTFASVNS
jgi:catechol-2,3-dioxygenase